MGNLLTVFLFALGLILIIKCGDWFVDSASWIAEASGIPKFIVGATIVSIGTTLPEMLVSTMATVKGNVEMAAGNAIGSVTANTGMILGLFIVCMPFAVKRSEFAFKAILMFLSSCALLGLSFTGNLSIIGSIVMFGIFIAFFIENFVSAKKDAANDLKEHRFNIGNGLDVNANNIVDDDTGAKVIVHKKDIIKNVSFFLIGAAGIAVGAQLLVTNGTKIAELLNISQRVISVIAIAIGTSLPELVTTLTALKKKEGSLSVGNILGANIIDLTLILPICSFISKGSLTVKASTISYDLPACIGIIAIAVFPSLFTKKFQRWQGILMLTCYAAYLILTVFVLG